mmetsp:Transcript_15228/g.42624  ORF Transcript_15228/g.42624 Transcript_15228/m.42624 type:complete len:245 (-) Transcript_15228:179-913(-)
MEDTENAIDHTDPGVLQQLGDRPRSCIEEVYTRIYLPAFGGSELNDMYAYCHPNGLAVVGITGLHPLVHEIRRLKEQNRDAEDGAAAAAETSDECQGMALEADRGALPCGEGSEPAVAPVDPGELAVDFSKGNVDRAATKKSGKHSGGSKGGGVHLQPDSILCRVKVPGAQEVAKIRSGVKGVLLEVNERLIAHPELLGSSPQQEGFIAIIKLQQGAAENLKETGLDPASYAKLRSIPEADLGM